jgi:hypothetical protein
MLDDFWLSLDWFVARIFFVQENALHFDPFVLSRHGRPLPRSIVVSCPQCPELECSIFMPEEVNIPAKKAATLTDADRAKNMRKLAREVEASDDPAILDGALRKIVRTPPTLVGAANPSEKNERHD